MSLLNTKTMQSNSCYWRCRSIVTSNSVMTLEPAFHLLPLVLAFRRLSTHDLVVMQLSLELMEHLPFRLTCVRGSSTKHV